MIGTKAGTKLMKKVSAGPQYFCLKNGTYYYRRVIPMKHRSLAGRSEFKESLDTSDYNKALEAYLKVHIYCDALMDKLKAGINIKATTPTASDREKFAAANNLALLSIEEIIEDPYELKKRIETFEKNKNKNKNNFDLLFGNVKSEILLSGLVDYFLNVEKHKIAMLNTRELQKLINPKKLAINKLIAFIGEDIPLTDLTRVHAKNFYKRLKSDIASKIIMENTAGKYITNIRVLIKKYYDDNDIESKSVFDGLNFSSQMNARLPFSVNYLKKTWINNPVFDKMNTDARTLLFAMLDTGAIASELIGLVPDEEIILNADIPYINIRHNKNRTLKTAHRGREIPLIGHALKAFQDNPKGFTRYCGPNGAENASAVILKFLKENDLKETERHVVYSLSHTFKDRLRNHNVPQELQNYFMGHKDASMGAHYGAGYSLEKSYEYMKLIEADFC